MIRSWSTAQDIQIIYCPFFLGWSSKFNNFDYFSHFTGTENICNTQFYLYPGDIFTYPLAQRYTGKFLTQVLAPVTNICCNIFKEDEKR